MFLDFRRHVLDARCSEPPRAKTEGSLVVQLDCRPDQTPRTDCQLVLEYNDVAAPVVDDVRLHCAAAVAVVTAVGIALDAVAAAQRVGTTAVVAVERVY